MDLKRQAITVRSLKGSLDTVQLLYPHRGVPLLDELAALRAYLRDRDDEMAQISCSRSRKAAAFIVASSSACSSRLPSLWGCLQTSGILTF